MKFAVAKNKHQLTKRTKKWDDINNQRKHFDSVSKKLNFKCLEDWKSAEDYRTIYAETASILVSNYRGNLKEALKAIYPNYDWEFEVSKPSGYWNNVNNVKKFLEELFISLKLEKIEDFRNVSYNTLKKYGGGPIFNTTKNFTELLRKIYPHINWNIRNKEKNYWKSTFNQRKSLEELYFKLELKSFEDWRFVPSAVFKNNGIHWVSEFYPSTENALQTLFPNYCWESFDILDRKDRLFSIQKKYLIEKKSDWYRIAISSSSRLIKYLSIVHKDQSWSQYYFRYRDKRTKQRFLYISLRSIYPNYLLLENYRHSYLTSQTTDYLLELDIYIPSLNIAFEYQGQQHFDEIPKAFAPFLLYSSRDEEKIRLCNERNISIIYVPYWWDKTTDSLISVINNYQFEKRLTFSF